MKAITPTVWARTDQLRQARTGGGLLCAMYPDTVGRTDLEPLYDRAALDAKDAEIERLTDDLDEARGEASVARLAFEQVTAERDEARTEARVAYLAFEQVKASRAKLREAIAALLDDDDHDTAKELARAAMKGDKP